MTRTLIIKRSVPNEDWKQYNCKIHYSFDSYTMALEYEKKMAATSESEGNQEQRPGKRRIKQKKNAAEYEKIINPPSYCSDQTDDEDSSCTKETSSSSCNSVWDNPDNLESAHSHSSGNEHNEMGSVKDSNIICSKGTDPPDEKLVDKSSDDADITILDNVPFVVPADQLSDMMKIIVEIRSMCQITLLKVNAIVEPLNIKQKNGRETSDDLIKDLLPLSSMDSLLKLEELMMKNDVAVPQFMNKLVLVGGSDYKNLIRRCLQQIFDDELAQLCSWTGQKQNFKISDLKFIDLLKRSINETFRSTTDKDFESVVMEWMRFAKQRLKRRE